MKTLDRILRDGTSAEFCALYEAVRRLRKHPNSQTRLATVLERYDDCEAASEEFDSLVEDFYESDGTAGEFNTTGGLRK